MRAKYSQLRFPNLCTQNSRSSPYKKSKSIAKSFRSTTSANVNEKLLSVYLYFRYDTDRSNFIDFMELKLMMEKLGSPQTHLSLKAMIKEVDEDNDGQISFREVRKK